MSLLREGARPRNLETTQNRLRTPDAAVSKSELLAPAPIFTLKDGQEPTISAFDRKLPDQMVVFNAASNEGGRVRQWFRRTFTSSTGKVDQEDGSRPAGQTDITGGGPPTDRDNIGAGEYEWDEKDHRVAAIIGAEKVADTVISMRRLRTFSELVKAPDPFKAKKTSKTLIDERRRRALDTVEQVFERYSTLTEEDTRVLRQHAPVLAEATGEVRRLNHVYARMDNLMPEAHQKIDALEVPKPIERGAKPDATRVESFIETAREYLGELGEIATTLPTDASLRELAQLFHAEGTALRYDAYAVGRQLRRTRKDVAAIDTISREDAQNDGTMRDRHLNLRVRITQAGFIEQVIRNNHRSAKVIGRDEAAVNLFLNINPKRICEGSSSFNVLKAKVADGSRGTIANLYGLLDSMYKSIPFVANESLENAAIVEDYVIEKAAFLEKSIREMHGKVPDNMRKRLRTYQQKSYGPELRRVEAQTVTAEPELPLPDDFRRDTTFVRDIVNGGVRIKAKGANQLAKALYALKSNDAEELLPPEARGLVVSLATEKFQLDPVLRVMDEFERGNGDEGSSLIRALHQHLPDRYNAISRFDRTSLLETVDLLQEVLGNQATEKTITDVVANTLGTNRTDSIRDGLADIKNKLLGRTKIDIEDYQQLDWTVLPEGSLRGEAERIISMVRGRSKSPESIEIDLDRLNILEAIKNSWNKGDAYYARGSLGKRREVKTKDGRHEPEEYIILVLQNTGPDGEVHEHAVAESPIAQRNAVYIHRSDVSEEIWKDVFSLPKDYARGFGARALQHRKRGGISLNDSMVQKITGLLNCSPEDFPDIRLDRL